MLNRHHNPSKYTNKNVAITILHYFKNLTLVALLLLLLLLLLLIVYNGCLTSKEARKLQLKKENIYKKTKRKRKRHEMTA